MSPSADVKSTSTFSWGLEAKGMRPAISRRGKTASLNVVLLSDGAPKGNPTIAFYTLFLFTEEGPAVGKYLSAVEFTIGNVAA